MVRYFAEIEPCSKLVKRIVVAEDIAWCETHLGGTWVETYIDRPNVHYAGEGYTYLPNLDNFCPPKPFPSWLFDESKCNWVPPVAMPMGDGKDYLWNEDELAWIAI